MLINITIVSFALLFSAFFSGMEIAFISSNKLRIEIDRKQGKFSSKIISKFTNNQGRYIATMLVGNNIALVVYGLVMAIILEPYILQLVNNSNIWTLIIQTILSTLLILFAAEFIPKTVFKINSNFSLNFFSIPVFLFYILFYPITSITMSITGIFIKYFVKINNADDSEQKVFGKIDLTNFLNQANKDIEPNDDIEEELKIIQNVLDFSKIKLRECIVPRNEIKAVPTTADIDTVRRKMLETGFSKILIYKNTIDNIVGYVHSLELFKLPKTIKSITVKIPIVPETMSAKKLFDILSEKNKSVALVVDEYGGTAGIVTVEDILEEIFGEIEDEHDSNDMKEKQVSENKYIFAGRLEINYLNEKYNFEIPTSEEFTTIAGFILNNHETIPQKDEIIIIDKYKITIIEVNTPRIDLISFEVTD